MTVDHLGANLDGKVALVTGGAASGVGLAVARLLQEYGVSVVAEDVNPDVVEVFSGLDGVVPFVGDVTTERAATDAVALAEDRFGGLDILINNAGVIINKPIVETTLDDWNRILGVNVTGAFLHTREAMRVMAPRRRGAIVNIGSYACFQSFGTISAYAASKGALAQLTRTAALEGIDHGIRVNAIGSGDVVTNILGDPRRPRRARQGRSDQTRGRSHRDRSRRGVPRIRSRKFRGWCGMDAGRRNECRHSELTALGFDGGAV